MKQHTVLYVDDEISNLHAFKASFRRVFKVYIANSAQEGLNILQQEKIKVVITDQRMPEVNGVEFLKMVIKEHPACIRMLLTGYSDINAIIGAINEGQIFKYVTKPWNDEYLKLSINQAAEMYDLKEENQKLTKELLKVNSQLEFMLRQKLSVE